MLVVAALGLVSPAFGEELDPGLIGRRIVAIDFDCVAPIDRRGLAHVMPMKVGDPLRAADLEEARWRLGQKQIFTDIRIVLEPRGEQVAVVVTLVRKSVLDRMRFEGNDALSDKELRRMVRLRENMAVSEELRQYSVERLHERYVAEGFPDVQVRSEVIPGAPGEVDVVFRIRQGEPLRITAIVIEGGQPLSYEQIRKASGLEVGDRYVREEHRKAERSVVRVFRGHGYYEAEVAAKWEPGADKGGTLRFEIDPGPPFQLEFTGNRHLSDKKLLRLIDLPKRPIVTDGTWRELARRAQRAYQDEGYYFARVDLSLQSGPPKVVHFTVDEGQQFHVGGVRFEGNHGLSARELLAVMATRPPSWVPWWRGVLLDNVLDDDMKRLWYLYRRHGFESAEILDDRTRFEPTEGRVYLTVVINEKVQTVVRAIELTGVEPIKDKLPEFTLRVGDPLDPEKVEKDRQALLTALAAVGYTQAEVKADVTTKPSGALESATVHLDAQPGAQQRIGTIIVQNNFDTNASVIMRELPFVRGEPLDPSALLRGQGNIYKLGIFRSVTVRPLEMETEQAPPLAGAELEKGREPESVLRGQGPTQPPVEAVGHPAARPNRHDIGVTVAEKPPITLQYGGGYNTRDGFRGFLEVAHENLQRVARRLSLRGEFNLEPGDVTPNEYLGNLGFREPRLDATAWTFRSNLIAQRSTRHVDQFSLERFAFIPALERTFLPGLQAGMEMQVEQAQVFDLAPDVFNFNPLDQGRLRTNSVGPFAVYDGRDDPFAPHSGFYETVRLRVAPRQLGSDIPLVKVFMQHVQYVPLDENLTFVYVLRGGWADAYHNRDIVPIRERFFLGGRTTVRGFDENSIGPSGNAFIDANGNPQSGGDPLGGNLIANVNTELRFPLLYGFGGAVFVDGGGVYLVDVSGTPGSCSGCGGVSLHDFRRSAGLGLRYLTPVGPLSLDYGFKLDRRADEAIGAVHFSVGTVF